MPTHSIEWVPFPQLLLRGAARHPDRDCIVLTDARLTYAQLEERARAAARSLLALGVEPGDRVGILMANCLDYVEMLFGASLIGAVPVLYNARFKAREIAHVTTDAGVRVEVDAVVDRNPLGEKFDCRLRLDQRSIRVFDVCRRRGGPASKGVVGSLERVFL